ncbi:MAG: hypothetical protein AB7E05_04015 [Sphingobium sp.]
MNRALLTALLISTFSVPAVAQQQTETPATPAATPEAAPATTPEAAPAATPESAPAAPASAPAAADAATPAAELTPEQIAAFNQAVKDFGAGQQAQQANDNATASAKYTAALPAIRDMVKAQPDNMENVNFLANALYASAAAEIALQKTDQGVALMEESIPHWRKVAAANASDTASQKVLASIATQVANVKLSKQDKAGAAPLYNEAITLSRKLVAATPDAANKNLLLGALIGASQTSEDAAIKTEAASLSKSMLADGSVDAANKPAAEILGGGAATPAAPAQAQPAPAR